MRRRGRDVPQTLSYLLSLLTPSFKLFCLLSLSARSRPSITLNYGCTASACDQATAPSCVTAREHRLTAAIISYSYDSAPFQHFDLSLIHPSSSSGFHYFFSGLFSWTFSRHSERLLFWQIDRTKTRLSSRCHYKHTRLLQKPKH